MDLAEDLDGTDPGTGSCRRCGAGLVDGSRFCTACGAPTSARTEAPPPEQDEAPPSARLVECPACGAGNAASRPLCARCATPLRAEVPGGDALPDDAHPDDYWPVGAVPTGRLSDPSPVVLSLVLLAGLVTAGVLLALVTSQVTRDPTPAVPTGVVVRGATASTALDGQPAALAVDGDPTTAWTEGAPGEGVEEWLEVRLPAPVEVRRLLIWNGDQGGEGRFADNARASRLRIEVGDRQFRVDLLDIQGPQGVDLPGGLLTDRIRLVVEEAVAGDRYTDLAISEVVVEAAPDS